MVGGSSPHKGILLEEKRKKKRKSLGKIPQVKKAHPTKLLGNKVENLALKWRRSLIRNLKMMLFPGMFQVRRLLYLSKDI